MTWVNHESSPVVVTIHPKAKSGVMRDTMTTSTGANGGIVPLIAASRNGNIGVRGLMETGEEKWTPVPYTPAGPSQTRPRKHLTYLDNSRPPRDHRRYAD
jgi:hypothetical protein